MLFVETDTNRFVSGKSFRDRFTVVPRDRINSSRIPLMRLEGNRVLGIFPEETLHGYIANK